MTTFLIIVAVIVVLLVLRAGTKTTVVSGRSPFSFPASDLVNATEKKFYWRLQEALPDHVVLCQVALSQMLTKTPGKAAFANWNRIDRKVCDFVICTQDFRVLAVIETDGPTHRKARQQQRDADKTSALEAAGYRVIRFSTDVLPSATVILTALGLAQPAQDGELPAADPAGRTAPTLN